MRCSPNSTRSGKIPRPVSHSVKERLWLRFEDQGIPGGRVFIVDSGTTCNLISWKDLSQKEKTSKSKVVPVEFQTANGTAVSTSVVIAWVHSLACELPFFVLPDAPPLISLGELCTKHNFRYVWEGAQVPYLQIRKPKIITDFLPSLQQYPYDLNPAAGGYLEGRSLN